jgi:hypothetical protein
MDSYCVEVVTDSDGFVATASDGSGQQVTATSSVSGWEAAKDALASLEPDPHDDHALIVDGLDDHAAAPGDGQPCDECLRFIPDGGDGELPNCHHAARCSLYDSDAA